MSVERMVCRVRFGAEFLSWLVVWAVVLTVAVQGKLASAENAGPFPQNNGSATKGPLEPALLTDIVGIWQGTLHVAQPGSDLRIEIRVAKDDKGGYIATLYSISQDAQPIVATKTSFEKGVFSFSINFISAKYEGNMSVDGESIAGMWTQGPNPIALNLVRTKPDEAWPIPEPIKPMAPDADPGFEVVTIKPSQPGAQNKWFGLDATYFRTRNTSMNDLIAFAYGLHSKQIEGAPDWFGTELFDIVGIPDVPGQPSLHQMELMIQKLLPSRFALKFHHEQRELSVYIITVAPSGPKIVKTTAGSNDQEGFGFKGMGDLIVRNMDMSEFATWMQTTVMDRPVVDRTMLTGKYDFTLRWTPDSSQFQEFRRTNPNMALPAGDNSNAPPSLYTAVQEQLGLKINADKAIDDAIIIDHAEKPSPN